MNQKTGGCEIPVHSEMQQVAHHVYTEHVQPTKWITHEVQYRPVPVSQEQRQVAHPEKCIQQQPMPSRPQCPSAAWAQGNGY